MRAEEAQWALLSECHCLGLNVYSKMTKYLHSRAALEASYMVMVIMAKVGCTGLLSWKLASSVGNSGYPVPHEFPAPYFVFWVSKIKHEFNLNTNLDDSIPTAVGSGCCPSWLLSGGTRRAALDPGPC